MTQLSDTIEPPVDEAGATGEPGASTNLFDHFDGVGTTEPADGATVAPPVDEAAEAQAGRERAATSASAIRPQTNYYDQFDSDHDAGEVSLEERMRLSAKDGYYRGTIAGAAELRRLVQAGQDNGWPADIKQQYESIVSDLARHDLLRPPSTPAEAAAVLAGQVVSGVTRWFEPRPAGDITATSPGGKVAPDQSAAAEPAATAVTQNPALTASNAFVQLLRKEVSQWFEPRPAGDITAVSPGGKVARNQSDATDQVVAGLGLVSSLAAFLPIPGAQVARAAGTASRLARAESMASRLLPLYHPPAKPARAFAEDYRQGARADAAGRLTHNIEGKPLTAEFIAGRRLVGEPDQPLSLPDVRAAATQATGQQPMAVAGREIGGDAGRFILDRDRRSGSVIKAEILYNKALNEGQADRVIAHEFAHAIDLLSGKIPTTGLKTELRQLYNTLNSGQERTRNLSGPQYRGYRGEEVDRELMAEAIRAYMADPNYMKAVAPRTATAIREAVNDNPRLARTIQFNALGPVAGVTVLSLPEDHQ